MATVTLTVVTGTTTSVTATFTAVDAGRVLTAYQNQVKAGGTQQDLTNWLGGEMKSVLANLVIKSERTTPAPPAFT